MTGWRYSRAQNAAIRAAAGMARPLAEPHKPRPVAAPREHRKAAAGIQSNAVYREAKERAMREALQTNLTTAVREAKTCSDAVRPDHADGAPQARTMAADTVDDDTAARGSRGGADAKTRQGKASESSGQHGSITGIQEEEMHAIGKSEQGKSSRKRRRRQDGQAGAGLRAAEEAPKQPVITRRGRLSKRPKHRNDLG